MTNSISKTAFDQCQSITKPKKGRPKSSNTSSATLSQSISSNKIARTRRRGSGNLTSNPLQLQPHVSQTPINISTENPFQIPLSLSGQTTPSLSPTTNSLQKSRLLGIPGLGPSNAPTWARHAAARAITRRKTHEEIASCGHCGTNIATIYMRGTQQSFEVGYIIELWCQNCENLRNNNLSNMGMTQNQTQNGSPASSQSFQLSRNPSFTRKRGRETPSVECEVCKRCLGSGGVRKRPADDNDISMSWEEPEMMIEFVCTQSCASKYLFCSECGGGGRSRTGKWRPRQLFGSGRKTCSLPHIRIGDAPVQYRVLEVPSELTNPILQGVQDVFFDMALSLYAIPALIELPKYGSYDAIRQEIEKQWRETVLDVLTTKVYDPFADGNQVSPVIGNKSLGKKKYLTVAWINKIQRNKGKMLKSTVSSNTSSASLGSTSQVPWLSRLALEGMVAPTHRNDENDSNDGDDRVYVGFCISEWDRDHNTLFMVQIAPRSAFLPTMETYGELLRRAVDRVQADARRDMLAPISHLWCWTRGDHHARLSSIPERLGFVTREQYVTENPEFLEIAPQMFGSHRSNENRSDNNMEIDENQTSGSSAVDRYPFLQDRGDGRGSVTVFVSHVRDFMAPKVGKKKPKICK
ncbi:hypothetical protein HK096_008252 [Nowakowskiella sp. JEL0078]|nr:hypothetical protein HK096_008252 [Nowakowskiella sp. JEL0078]